VSVIQLVGEQPLNELEFVEHNGEPVYEVSGRSMSLLSHGIYDLTTVVV